ncbi:MAG: NADPH-dependent F420 reductase [Anaerolineae bacterium]
MNIGVIGAGHVGGMLGRLLAEHGHRVMFGMRDTSTLKGEAQEAVDEYGARTGTLQEAVDFGEVVVLAVPGNSVQDVVTGLHNWQGKILMDTNNRFGTQTPGHSMAEDIARWAEGAHVVKAFNTLGANRFDQPTLGGQQISMFICGDDDGAKQVVSGLVIDLGFDLVDVGGLGQAALLEKLAELWVMLARSGFGRDIAFKLLR